MALPMQLEWLRLNSGAVRHLCVPPDANVVGDVTAALARIKMPEITRAQVETVIAEYRAICGRRGVSNMEPYSHFTKWGGTMVSNPARYPECSTCIKVLLATMPDSLVRSLVDEVRRVKSKEGADTRRDGHQRSTRRKATTQTARRAVGGAGR